MSPMRLGCLVVPCATLLASAVAPLSKTGAQAPSRTLDEGTFLVTKGGAPAGRESFRITLSARGSAEAYRATAQVVLGERRIVPTLTCDSLGAPISYDVSVQGGTDPTARLQARARPGRFSSMLRTREGESTREYVVPAGVVVLDDDIVHQLYFLTLGGRRSGTVTVLAPRTGIQAVATLQSLGAGSVDIGGVSVPGTHLVLTAPGFARRDFWIDAGGRVLKAAIPEYGIVAQRDEPPR
ncbi:MAG TPA: hypothetical protein VJW73_14470 [Gemmatimonadaceae bacterium]|nr:hypothetical protein [Gemmatimonadaceae bacterium]